MLARLSIRDIVLIERLDIEFSRGLAVLTGETGAGKSILLDAFALALGGRGDAGLVRHGVEQGQVTAVFDVPKGHPASAILSDNGLDDTGEMILRRVQLADGRTRAFINDQAISVQTLKAVGSALVEIHGQHDERALVDASTHRRLLDAFAGLEKDVVALEALWDARRAALTALDAHRAGMERAAREADYLRHASDELKKLKPKDGEETALAERRTGMMQGEKIASDLREAQDAVSGNHSPVSALSAAVRRLERRAGNSPDAGRTRGEGDRCRHQCAGGSRPASHGGADRGRLRSLRAGTHRGAAVRAARRLAQIFDAGRWSRRTGGEIRRRRGADRCRRRSAEEAGSRSRRGRQALWRRRHQALRRADEIGGKAQQGRQRRTGAAEARAGQVHGAD